MGSIFSKFWTAKWSKFEVQKLPKWDSLWLRTNLLPKGLNSTREGGVYVRKSDPKPDYVNKTPKAIPEREKLAYTEVFIDSITVIPLT